MNIVLCGSDGTFKTTIANKLSSKLNLPINKGSSFELSTGSNKELFEFSKGVIADKKYQITDRFIYSNRVYATLYPEYTVLTDTQREKIENKIKKTGSIVIYLVASPDIIINRIKERGDEYITTDEIPSILRLYNIAMTDAVDNGVIVYTYDTGVLSSDKIVEQILQTPELKKLSAVKPTTPAVIKCHSCGKTVKSDNNLFSGTHCFKCYNRILQEFFEFDE